MQTAKIAKIAVSSVPYFIDKPYHYLIPDSFLDDAVLGVRVIVPFGAGNKKHEGIILDRYEGEKRQGLKPILKILDTTPLLDQSGIALALWMRQRYFCTVFDAFRAILPAGLWYRIREIWRLNVDNTEPEGITDTVALKILDELTAHGGEMQLEDIQESCGKNIYSVLQSLETAGILRCETLVKQNATARTYRAAELVVSAEELLALPHRRHSARYEVIRFLAHSGKTACTDICYYTGASMNVLRRLKKENIIAFTDEEEPPILPKTDSKPFNPLNLEQQQACNKILELIDSPKGEVILLHGVTGSGKTQVYLHLVKETLQRGKTAIILVPEIVLTPQMMREFTSRFGATVALLHSSLQVKERYEQWQRIRRGEAKIALGVRSAIFAPLKNLGLIILDEEQESGYQSNHSPRYHARDIAKYLCVQNNAVLVLGSATPMVETVWSAKQNLYHEAQLLHRYNERSLPEVIITDLREELRAGNAGLIGRRLKQELEQNLERGEQSILFLNRRGNSRMLLCIECSYVPECPRCSVPMTYHSANNRLMCHYCGHSQKIINQCPKCGGTIKRIGAGTQKVEEELHQLFPNVDILRMDADTASGRHDKLLTQFEQEKIPILLGTQMVAKGLDFENVTLAAALCADLSMYAQHYRATERTFSMLTQITGRAGRGEKTGRAVIQTYAADNDVILSAAAQDYERFYKDEIRIRHLRRFPPFADLFTLTVSGLEENTVFHAAIWVRDTLRTLCAKEELAALHSEVIGPAPAPILRLNNRFRYQISLVGKNDKNTRASLSWLLRSFAADRSNRGLWLFVDCNMSE